MQVRDLLSLGIGGLASVYLLVLAVPHNISLYQMSAGGYINLGEFEEAKAAGARDRREFLAIKADREAEHRLRVEDVGRRAIADREAQTERRRVEEERQAAARAALTSDSLPTNQAVGSSNLSNAEWVRVGSIDQDTVYIGPSTLRVVNQTRRISQLIEFDQVTRRGSKSSIAVIEIDCAENRSRMLSMTVYPKSMATGQGVPSDSDMMPTRWVNPPSHMLGATINRHVCALPRTP